MTNVQFCHLKYITNVKKPSRVVSWDSIRIIGLYNHIRDYSQGISYPFGAMCSPDVLLQVQRGELCNRWPSYSANVGLHIIFQVAGEQCRQLPKYIISVNQRWGTQSRCSIGKVKTWHFTTQSWATLINKIYLNLDHKLGMNIHLQSSKTIDCNYSSITQFQRWFNYIR